MLRADISLMLRHFLFDAYAAIDYAIIDYAISLPPLAIAAIDFSD